MAGRLAGWLAGGLVGCGGWVVGRWLLVDRLAGGGIVTGAVGGWGRAGSGGGAAVEHGVRGADEGGVDGGAEEKLALRGESAATWCVGI